MLPIITHFAEGGEIEHEDIDGNWETVDHPTFCASASTYRKKPTPRLVLRTSDDPELVWLKRPNGPIQYILGVRSDGRLDTQSWLDSVENFHEKGYLCSATRNGPWLPLVKEEIV